MDDFERKIIEEANAGNQCEVINNYGEYFMDLCRDAAKYLPNDQEENANNIFDWLANGCELDESDFDAESLAIEYMNYYDMTVYRVVQNIKNEPWQTTTLLITDDEEKAIDFAKSMNDKDVEIWTNFTDTSYDTVNY